MHRVVGARVTLGPPNDDDLTWIMDALARPDVWSALGWSDGIGSEVYGGYIEGTVLLLPFWNAQKERVGFILLMRETTDSGEWAVHIVVPDKNKRNGFTAIAACDALCHLVFIMRNERGLFWLIEPSNGASKVLPKRLGYKKLDEIDRDGTRYERFIIGPEDWERRKTRRKLDFEGHDVPLSEVGHGRIIQAVRARP